MDLETSLFLGVSLLLGPEDLDLETSVLVLSKLGGVFSASIKTILEFSFCLSCAISRFSFSAFASASLRWACSLFSSFFDSRSCDASSSFLLRR